MEIELGRLWRVKVFEIEWIENMLSEDGVVK